MGERCETGDYVASKRRHIQSCFRLSAPQRIRDFSGTDKLETRRRLRQLFPGGDSHVKGAVMLVRNFELNP